VLPRLRQQFPRTGAITEIEPIARRMRRIRIAGDTLRHLPWRPGQQLRVRLRPTILLPDSLRTYSVWNYDPERGALDLCVLLHGDGPGAAWARGARVGDAVTFWGPRGNFVLESGARYHLFAGEETAAVAIQAMIRALPETATVVCRLEADAPEDELPALPRALDLQWVHRRGRAAGPESGLVDAVRRLVLPSELGMAYVAGETTTCLALRDHLTHERGWPRRTVRVKPFWARGRKGLE